MLRRSNTVILSCNDVFFLCVTGTTNEDKAAPKSTKRKQMSGLKSARMPKQTKCFGVAPSSINISKPGEGQSASNAGVSSVAEVGPISTSISTSDRLTSHNVISACRPPSSLAVATDKREIIENLSSVTSQVNSCVNLGVSDQQPPSHIYTLPSFMNTKSERPSDTQMSSGFKTEPWSDGPTSQGLIIVKAEPTSDTEMSQDDLSGMNVLPYDYTDVDGSSSHNSSVEFPQTIGPIRFGELNNFYAL